MESENVIVLADAVVSLYKDRDLCEKMGKTARMYGEKCFNVSKSYQRIVEMVEEQINA